MQNKRLLSALRRDGLEASNDGSSWTVKLQTEPHAPPADILLPPSLPVESKAFRQIAALAAARHPSGGRVVKACASPDFHPGDSGIAIGSVALADGMVIPQAVGGDINCGMRLHVADVSVDRFRRHRNAIVDSLKGDFFFGTRDVAMRARTSWAMLEHGLPGWLIEHDRRLGSVQRADWSQLEREIDRVHFGGSLRGSAAWAPEHLRPERVDAIVRDDGLATIGGGNHFVEILEVFEIRHRRRAFDWGVRSGQIAVMIHSGSRHVGKYVGAMWADLAKKAWPSHEKYPLNGLFPLSAATHPELANAYLEAEATAANYGFLNRLLLAELVRLRMREHLGEVELPLLYDVPHNITCREGHGFLSRKGACPAELDQPVIIPGSMGSSSYLLAGRGSDLLLKSASHGAGRAVTRFAMQGLDESELGLHGIDCITLRDERRIQEAPAAYKPIQPVIDCQVEAGIVDVVAVMRPILTFKA